MSDTKIWPKEARYLALIALFAGCIFILWYFHGILSPLIIAAIFAYVLHPAVDFLASRTRLSYTLSVLMVYIISILLLITIIGLITPVLINQVRAIELDLESVLSYYEDLMVTPANFFRRTVFPGQFPTCWLKPVSRLKTVLLPTLGCPAKATRMGRLSCAIIALTSPVRPVFCRPLHAPMRCVCRAA